MVKKDGLILEKNLRLREDWWVFGKTAPSRAVGTSPVPSGERGLGKAVEPSLMVKRDGVILEKSTSRAVGTSLVP